MQPVLRHSALPSRLSSIAIGLLLASVVAGLVVWRLGISIWEVVQVCSQVTLLVYGCWILRQDSFLGPSQSSPGSKQWSIPALGATFTAIWLFNYSRVGLFMSELPQEYEPVFQETPFAYVMFGFYMAESIFMQALLHRLLPGWACSLLGAVQASLFSSMTYRYNSTESFTPWRLFRTFVLPQVGMFAPYHLSRRWVQGAARQLGVQHTAQAALPSAQGKLAANAEPCKPPAVSNLSHTGPAEDTAVYDFEFHPPALVRDADFLDKDSWMKGAGVAPAAHASCTVADGETAKPSKAGPAATAAAVTSPTSSSGAPAVPAWPVPGPKQAAPAGHRSPRKSMQSNSYGRRSGERRRMSPTPEAELAMQVLYQPTYKSRLRAPRTACIKLGTHMRCDNLPPDLAQQLQDALCASIGGATSLCISDMAVRPGCICITLKLDELPSQGLKAIADMSALDIAQSVLPVLQSMLSVGQRTAAVKRATVQLQEQLVACVWKTEEQAWEIQACQELGSELAADRLWLGIATASTFQRAPSSLASSTLLAYTGLLEVLAEVQLWGVSKVADVEGWTPPQQHQDSELQWPGAQQPSGSSPALKLLARAAGGYLPTQVVRLVPGSTDGCVTAQVLVQLHEHQLVRHHEGGSPSTLLLMDLELWQNEVLLSSSPLLSLPAHMPPSETLPACSAWWWGAADRTVAAALAEVQQIAARCTAAMIQAGMAAEAAAAIQSYTAFVQDLTCWLMHVRGAACSNALCVYGSNPAVAIAASPQLRQPILPPALLQELGHDLTQYTKQMGWQQVQHMVAQQQRNVVQPAASRASQVPSPHKAFGTFFHSVRTVLLGCRCHLDEQMYKQQLAIYLSHVLMVSSGFQGLIGLVWGLRTLAWQSMRFHTWFALGWFLLHLTVMANMLLSRHRKQQQKRIADVKRAYKWITFTYIWRLCLHFLGTLIMASNRNMQNQAFQQPRLWIGSQLFLLVTEQVPASVMLPAPWGVAVSLLLEFPGLLVPVMRGATLHPAVAVGVTLLLSVGARIVLGLQLRRQVRGLLSSATARRGHQAHVKAE